MQTLPPTPKPPFLCLFFRTLFHRPYNGTKLFPALGVAGSCQSMQYVLSRRTPEIRGYTHDFTQTSLNAMPVLNFRAQNI